MLLKHICVNVYLCCFCSITKRYCISLDSAENFHYTNQGQDVHIPGTDDVVELERTRNAFTILGKLKYIHIFLKYNVMNLKLLVHPCRSATGPADGDISYTGSYSSSGECQHTSQWSWWGPQLH